MKRNSFIFLDKIVFGLVIITLSFTFSFGEDNIGKLSLKDRKQCQKMEKLLIDNENYRYHKINICNRTGVTKYINNNFDSYYGCYSNARVFIIIDQATNKVLGLTKLDFFYDEDFDEMIYTHNAEELENLKQSKINEGYYLDKSDFREFNNYNTGYLIDIHSEYNMSIYNDSPKYNYNEDKLPYRAIFSKNKPKKSNFVYLKINNCFVEDVYNDGKILKGRANRNKR